MGKALNSRGELIDTPAHSQNGAAKQRALQRRAVRASAMIADKARAALAETDHWAMPDYDKPLTTERKAYRESLRAIIRNPDPAQPFPSKPA